jgi:hypothetical protein
MKIGKVEVKVSLVAIGVFVVFCALLMAASLSSQEVRSQLIWLIPALFMLLLLPIALNYLSRNQYAELKPRYEGEAKSVRIRHINENMIGKIVRIEGVVECVHFQFLNRPQYTIGDRLGTIPVKMFTSPDEDIKVNDIVEVYGQVIRRYIFTGEPVINCVSISKLKKSPVKV